MNPSLTPRTHRLSLTLLALALSAGLAACGGGEAPEATGDATTALHVAAPAQAPRAQEAQQVTVQGCVVDRHHIPTTGVPVRVLSVQGRLLGSALSDSQGHFTLRLPAATEVLLQVDRPEGEALNLRVGTTAQRWDTCLLDEQA